MFAAFKSCALIISKNIIEYCAKTYMTFVVVQIKRVLFVEKKACLSLMPVLETSAVLDLMTVSV